MSDYETKEQWRWETRFPCIGFVKMPRKAFELPIWDEPSDGVLWLYCALRAAHKPYGDVAVGCFNSSQMKIASDLKWSRNSVRKHMDSLVAKRLIAVRTTKEGVKVKLLHWDWMANGS